MSFFSQFFLISSWLSVLLLGVLLGIFYALYWLKNKGASFYQRMGLALLCGVLLGLIGQWCMGFENLSMASLKESHLRFIYEFDSYLAFINTIFMSLLRLLVIPMVCIGIIHALIHINDNMRLGSLFGLCVFWLLFLTAIASLIGVALGVFTHLGFYADIEATRTLSTMRSFSEIITSLVPSNIITAMNANNIAGVVIFAVLIGIAARRIGNSAQSTNNHASTQQQDAAHISNNVANNVDKKSTSTSISAFTQDFANTQGKFASFVGVIDISYNIIITFAHVILQAMPYAIVAMIAHTILTNGFSILWQALHFVLLIFAAMVLMFVIQGVILLLHGLNPLIYIKKAFPPLLMAFASRSSAATLPLTISTLTQKLGVSSGVATCVASLGTTIGMNGCAGYYAGLSAVFIFHTLGIHIGIGEVIMIMFLCVIASFGVAGIPGIAVMAVSIVLTGLGLESHFALLGVIFAIDPILDMARTCSNVSGAMMASIVSDKKLGSINQEAYNR